MSDSPAIELPVVRPLWFRLARTVVVLACFAFTFTWLLRVSNRSLTEREPAGFAMGVLHGICMPAALPHLLLGRDVPIFAEHNTGRTYKLGITVGINVIGLFFFGGFYWRIHRVRNHLMTRASDEHAKSIG